MNETTNIAQTTHYRVHARLRRGDCSGAREAWAQGAGPVGGRRQSLVVRDHDHRRTPLAVETSQEVVQSVPGAIDAVATVDELEHIQTLIPEEWLPAAVGSAEQCASRVLDQLAAGADGVILHGSAPAELELVVRAYAAVRPEGRFEGRHANPAR